MKHEASNLTYYIRRETSNRRAIALVQTLLAQRDALEALLLEAMPYVENAETDPAYKQGIVRDLTARIRAQMET